MLALTNCANEAETTPNPKDDGYTLTATIANTDDTKTHLDGVDMKWSAGDVVAVMSDTDYTITDFTLTDGANSKSGKFRSETAKNGTKYLAFYPRSIAIITNIPYLRATIPTTQPYVADNISANTMPIYGVGNSLQNMTFQYAGNVLRFKLYTTDGNPISVKSIQVTNSTYAMAGEYYWGSGINYSNPSDPFGTFGYLHGTTSGNTNKSITLDCGAGVALSTDSANHTVFNIVAGAAQITALSVVITTTDNKIMSLAKPSTLCLSSICGKIFSFPAVLFVEDTVHENIKVRIDSSDENDWVSLSSGTTSPTTSIDVKTVNDAKMTAFELSIIANLIAGSASADGIDLDMSGAQYVSSSIEAFNGNLQIRSMKLPSNVTELPDNAFYRCRKLVSIDLTGVTSIGTYAFDDTAITTLTIPASVVSISASWIIRGTKVQNINVDEANTHFKSIDGVLFNKQGTQLLEYPRGNARTSYSVPEGVTTITAYSLMETNLITELTLPSSLTSIQSSGLQSSLYLKTIICNATVPPSVVAGSFANNTGGNATDKVVRVPAGTKATYESKWSVVADLGYTFEDGSTPSGVGATINGLATDNTNSGNPDYWN